MLRFIPILIMIFLIGPVFAGLMGSVLPSLGYLPALGGRSITSDYWLELYNMPGLGQATRTSLVTGIGATIISLLLTMGFVAGWSGSAPFRYLQRLISPLLSVPHAAAAFGLAFLIAPSGWISRVLSPGITGWDRPPDLLIVHDPAGLAMMAGLVIKEIPFLLLMSLAALPQTNSKRLSFVTGSLGYGRMWGWCLVTAPMLYKQIRLPVYAVLAYATSVVDVALILGPDNPPSLSVMVIKWMNDPDLSRRFTGAAGAVFQVGVTGLALLAWYLLERITGLCGRYFAQTGYRLQRDMWLRIVFMGFLGSTVLAVIAGLGSLVVWSFAGFWRFPEVLPPDWTIRVWEQQLPMMGAPLWTTLLLALSSALLALCTTLACLENESRNNIRLEGKVLVVLYLPLLVPQVGFLFGLQVLYLYLGVGFSFIALVLTHFIFVMPYTYLSLADSWHAFDARYAQVAAGLGKSPSQIFWQIRLPVLGRAILTAFAIGLAVSMGQYLATLLIGAGRWDTITTEAVALAAGSNRRLIGVYGLVQMLLPMIGFGLAIALPAIMYRNRRMLRVE